MLFVRNLYPHEITDNMLIENATEDNCKLIQTSTNKPKVKIDVINYRRMLAEEL